MGTKLFAPRPINPGNMNLQARAQGAGAYAGRMEAGNAAKDIAAAQALYKAHAFKPQTRGAAYPKVSEKV